MAKLATSPVALAKLATTVLAPASAFARVNPSYYLARDGKLATRIVDPGKLATVVLAAV